MKNIPLPSLLKILRPFFHLVCIFLGFIIGYQLRLGMDFTVKAEVIGFELTVLIAVISSFLFVLFGFINKIYSIWRNDSRGSLLRVGFEWILVISFFSYIGQGYIFEPVSRFVLIAGALLGILIVSLFDQFYFGRINKIEQKNPYKMLVLYKKHEFFSDFEESILQEKKYKIYGYNLSSSDQDLLGLIDSHDIIVLLGHTDNNFIQRLTDYVILKQKPFYQVGESNFLEDLLYSPSRLGSIVALEFKPSPLDGWSRILKRGIDMIGSVIGLILLSPLFIVIALAIKMDSPGPVFYLQKRVGKGGKLFDFIKFRSMKIEHCVGEKYGGEQAEKLYNDLINSDANEREGIIPKIINDPRVTKVGHWLRKTSIDELPQLWCVLKGSMSLIGPRPHLPREVENYEAWHKRLLSVKPGITGYAQLFGRHNQSLDDEARLDLYYIQNRNLLLDIYVIINTLKILHKGK